MEIKLNSDIDEKLKLLAKTRGNTPEEVAQEAVVHFVTNPRIGFESPTVPVPGQTREESKNPSTSNPPPPIPGTVEQSDLHSDKKHDSHDQKKHDPQHDKAAQNKAAQEKESQEKELFAAKHPDLHSEKPGTEKRPDLQSDKPGTEKYPKSSR